jgi:hypothetical protein
VTRRPGSPAAQSLQRNDHLIAIQGNSTDGVVLANIPQLFAPTVVSSLMGFMNRDPSLVLLVHRAVTHIRPSSALFESLPDDGLREQAPAAWAAREAAIAWERRQSRDSGTGGAHCNGEHGETAATAQPPSWLWSDDNPAACASTVMQGPSGTFLIRPSTKVGHLTFVLNDNLTLRKFAIASTGPGSFVMVGKTHPSLYDLVAHLKTNPILSRTGKPLRLVAPNGVAGGISWGGDDGGSSAL